MLNTLLITVHNNKAREMLKNLTNLTNLQIIDILETQFLVNWFKTSYIHVNVERKAAMV